jgi:signal transduction histidine kinase
MKFDPGTADLLVVDDEPTVLETISAILEDEGYKVATASNVSDALEQLKARHFDVVLTDLRMEDDGGLTLLAEIRKAWEGIVPLVLTGYASLETAVDALREGAYDYLIKPSEVSELKATVARAVDRSLLGRSLRERMIDLDVANRKLKDLSEDLQHRVDVATEELQRHVEQLEQAKLDLEEERESREQFISMVVHELGQPLTAINVYAQLLQRPDRAADMRERAGNGILAASKTLARLARDLSYASQLARRAFQINAGSFDLAALVRDQVEVARNSAENTEIGVDVPAEALTISGDQERLAQVISNLIANAFRHAPGHSVQVSLKVVRGEAVVSVQDTGPGIDPRQLELIFEPYVRLGTQGEEPSGAGLGLYIAKAIVDAHNGDIRVESELGHGTRFDVKLPIRAQASASSGESNPVIRS